MIYVQDKHKLRAAYKAHGNNDHGKHDMPVPARPASSRSSRSYLGRKGMVGREFLQVSGVTAKKRKEDQRTSSVTTSGTRSEVTSALRLMAMPANTPATAST
ncbi:MAG: hypothetical protein QOJ15_3456 [Bradyrhizobium sp.]|jgi:hypothetical protein|nr:hypothetical protein [Bradyrhizobium sp.]